MNRKILLLFVISIEIFFIIYLLNSFQQQGKFLIVVNPINKSQLMHSNEGEVKYFFEPVPNVIEIETINFLKKTAIRPVNNDSLYERYNYSVGKPNNTYRIVSLGDSFTMGLCVNVSDNYSEILEDMLNNHSKERGAFKKFEVINLGVGSYDIFFSSLRFEKRGVKYDPDLVIFLLKIDDFNIIEEIWGEVRNETNIPDMRTHRTEFLKVWNNKYEEYKSLLKNLDEEKLQKKYITGPLENFFDITEKEDIKVIIFTIFSSIGGDYDEILEKTMSNYSHVSYVKLNIDEDFYNKNLVVYYDKENTNLSDFHPNEMGHKVIALGLLDFLKSNI